MKKLISAVLTVAMILGIFAFGTTAANDTCLRLSDTSGATGYSAGSDSVNSYVVEQGGATLIFDVLVESYSVPSSGSLSEIFVFTGDSDYNYAGYNFNEGAFTAGAAKVWPTNFDGTNYSSYASRDYALETGTWYEIAFQFNGNEATVYLDGIPMVSAELDQVEHKYFIMYPRYCTILIDNLRVCGKDYNVRDRIGDVIAVDDFSGVTSTSTANWVFSSEGYTVSQSGCPMRELGDMVPSRTVAPEISGAYLQYKESGGSGIATLPADFSDYNGFAYVEDICVDRKSVGANFGVRFGSNYIAGYDWDNQCFRISQRSGYGFNTSASYTYAVADYTLESGKTYEFAVRQAGNTVSVYLNGIVVATATNNNFTASYSGVQITHYRLGASIDNVAIAYPDYNIKEAEGNTLCDLSFDESAEYLNSVGGFGIGVSGYGYSVVKGSPVPTVKVDSVEATEGYATVGISLSECPGYDAFELSISYPSDLTVTKATPAEITGGVCAVSTLSQNPLVLSCVTDGTAITDTDVIEITFAVPGASGDYTVSATVTPYFDDIPAAEITGSGTVTVPKAGITTGLPTGLTYDGEYLYWDYLDGASLYEIYVIYTDDGYEEYIDCIEETEYELIFEDWFTDSSEYNFKVYAYDEDNEIFAVSDTVSVIYEEDGSLYYSLDEYADVLYDRLLALIADREYSTANQGIVDAILDEAQTALHESDYYTMIDLYDQYYGELDAVPTGAEDAVLVGDANGDGVLSLSDCSYLSRILSGADIEIYPGADMDCDGFVTISDLSLIRRTIS